MTLSIKLNRRSKASLHEQLYKELRRAILSGQMRPSERVPSSRQLAISLDIARSTVTDIYMQLLAEGYLETKPGSGTFVTHELPQPSASSKVSRKKTQTKDLPITLSDYGRKLTGFTPAKTEMDEHEICFYGWRPDFSALPLTEWLRTQSRVYRNSQDALLDYSVDPLGHTGLREAIAQSCFRSRGVNCTALQVIVVLGLQQALDLVARIHIDKGDAVIVEDPGYPQTRDILSMAGAQICPIRVDESGLVTDELFKPGLANVKLMYLTPSHQFPTGSIMSLARRLSVLDWANKTGAIIIEDDYDSEYRYSGKSIPALQGLDSNNRVIYFGTFTKVLFPALTIGYLIVPVNLLDVYTKARRLVADQIPLPLQQALADFIVDGQLDRHIKRMRSLYNTRRRALIASLKKHFEKAVTIAGDNAGLHLIARFRTPFRDQEIVQLAAKSGVGIISTAPYYCRKNVPGEFLLGYGNLSAEEIDLGVRRLAKAMLR